MSDYEKNKSKKVPISFMLKNGATGNGYVHIKGENQRVTDYLASLGNKTFITLTNVASSAFAEKVICVNKDFFAYIVPLDGEEGK